MVHLSLFLSLVSESSKDQVTSLSLTWALCLCICFPLFPPCLCLSDPLFFSLSLSVFPTMIVDLSISPFSLVSFCLVCFEALFLGAYMFRILMSTL